MAMQQWLLLGILLVLATSLAQTAPAAANDVPANFNRTAFPKNFLFGAASSAYQYEGAFNRGKCIFDTYFHKFPNITPDSSNGDVGDDFYHRYKEDIQRMKKQGLNSFRMSISWPRVLPYGKLSRGVSKEGIKFYNDVIDELLANGITPFVTIFHWDVPQTLADEYGGFLSYNITHDFQDFAELCFKEFGDRVKYWLTVNEPYVFTVSVYQLGALVPERCLGVTSPDCPTSDASTPYTIGHNILLSHAKAVRLYKRKYQPIQKGEIGITLVTQWMVPYNNKSNLDYRAARRALDFMYGWFFHPIVYGDYPRDMRNIVRKRLPKFTPEESASLRGSYDFIGLNYYTTNYAAHVPFDNSAPVSFDADPHANTTTSRNGVPIGTPTGVTTFFSVPWGLRDLLIYTKEHYKNPVIYITENGMGDYNNQTVNEGIKDPQRIDFYYHHLMAVKEAISKGVRVKGYIAWSFLDTFEWGAGFTYRFGLNFVDYTNNLKRTAKASAHWFQKFLLK
ncbi:beta-glucosidase 12-like [Diospyros lotus]|uniref:beta-glucosidase 12-like n=1 Tax=Diospyros lotus TaxID=55363 RepID=UPI00225B85B9|nr:beta-glucosidase 12-like [Diospyros lotus]